MDTTASESGPFGSGQMLPPLDPPAEAPRPEPSAAKDWRHASNVGSAERFVSTTCGFAILVKGLLPGHKLSLPRLLLGGALLWHGLKNHSSLYEQLGIGRDDIDVSGR
ncbi:MAG: hypothetical protein CMJ31_11560 [Phycisphaerae bacterium]|nr:hypothetical protein [Phycisphaerae bacterium]